MIIVVGSTNQAKIQAVKEVIKDYPLLAEAKIVAMQVSSEISEQPLSLEEIIQGAKNRAKNAFTVEKCTFAIGLESGLFEAKGSQTGFLEACICSIYDGATHSLGLSSGFEVPPQILHLVLKKKMDLTQACNEFGVSKNPKLGASDGLIGLLTKGRVTRREYTKQSLVTALIQMENAHLYGQ